MPQVSQWIGRAEVASPSGRQHQFGWIGVVASPVYGAAVFEFNHAVARTLIRVNTYFTSGVY
jgi:hypothetical protein